MDSSQGKSLVEQLLPLVGVLIGSFVTILVNVIATKMRNKRDDYIFKRDKLERLFICARKLRGVYQSVAFRVAESYDNSRTGELKNDLQLNMIVEKTSDLYAEIRIIINFYFPQLDVGFKRLSDKNVE